MTAAAAALLFWLVSVFAKPSQRWLYTAPLVTMSASALAWFSGWDAVAVATATYTFVLLLTAYLIDVTEKTQNKLRKAADSFVASLSATTVRLAAFRPKGSPRQRAVQVSAALIVISASISLAASWNWLAAIAATLLWLPFCRRTHVPTTPLMTIGAIASMISVIGVATDTPDIWHVAFALALGLAFLSVAKNAGRKGR